MAIPVLALLASSFTAPAAEPGSAPAGDSDPRPVVRIAVRNEFRPDDTIYPQIVEGRLITDLEDMETFRAASAGKPGEYLLTLTIKSLDLASGTYYQDVRDPESSGSLKTTDSVTTSMDFHLRLEDREGRLVHETKMNVRASREMEVSVEETSRLLTQELVDRAAVKIEKLLRKTLKKR